MKIKEYNFSNRSLSYYFDESIDRLNNYADPSRTILIIDDQVNHFHENKFSGWRKIIVQGNESSKSIDIFQQVADELLRLEADRKTMLIGIGGGVVTDLTGFVASVYMRGISYAFVPTTLLAQVDAAIGGKNGINYGKYKNMLGIIRQPEFLLFDYDLLNTLPDTELYNGFAEIIKYACICDADLFDYLDKNRDKALSRNKQVISKLVERSAEIKSEIVQQDEFENGKRRLLNFGHTIGHAVEKIEKIAHGQAVAIGMNAAANFSEQLSGLSHEEKQRIKQLIESYHLPVQLQSDPEKIEQLFRMDKKREQGFIHFILLEKIGQAVIKPVTLDTIKQLLTTNNIPL
jgi:3-dehydroquinate synthase